MDPDTAIGGAASAFPRTRWSAILAARSAVGAERTRALDALVAAYWKPVYKYIRLRWGKSNEDAKDLTQGFFLRVMEKDFFRAYDPERAAFRTYLRACVDGWVSNDARAAERLKRGGEFTHVSFDFETAEGEIRQLDVPDPHNLDQYFHQEWVRSLFAMALDALRAECEDAGKTAAFRLFERYDLEPDAGLTYDRLAAEFRIPVTAVTNHLAWARRQFRRVALSRLREITATDAEFRAEARALFGVNGA